MDHLMFISVLFMYIIVLVIHHTLVHYIISTYRYILYMWKDLLCEMLVVSTLLRFLWKYFCVALAISSYH